MKNVLVVVDMQKDFVDGALGTPEAQAITPKVADTVKAWEGEIFVTFDTHFENYLATAEGQKLPVAHCIKGTDGWELTKAVQRALETKTYTVVEKLTFGSVILADLIKQAVGEEPFDITLMGLCTDICVVSNALLLKAAFPEVPITVYADRCAGVTPETHSAALTTMKMCQINVQGE